MHARKQAILTMGATLARSAAIGQRAIAISAGPPLRRGALRGAHGNPGRARALAWNRVCGAIGSEFSDARAVELKCADRATKFYTANFIGPTPPPQNLQYGTHGALLNRRRGCEASHVT